jgi:hypothetical protein
VHKRPGASPTGSIWFTLFDSEADAPRATKVTVPESELSVPGGGWIRVAGAEIRPGLAEGSLESEALSASWSLRFSGDDEPCRYLPADWLYEAPLPRTKFVAPYPNARYGGVLRIDGEEIEIEGWPGMVGPQLGDRARRALVWLEGTGFEGAGDTWFDAGAARVRVGRWTTRWIPSGMLVLDGERHRLGGLARSARPASSESPTRCDFVLPAGA